MFEPPSCEAVLEGGLDGLLNPASARRQAGAWLPALVAHRLSKPVEAEDRLRWATRYVHREWPRLLLEQAGSEDGGWPELLGGCAAAIELLCGRLPPQIEARLVGTRARAVWESVRAKYERYVLLLGDQAQVCRVFVGGPLAFTPAAPENRVQWRVDGPPFRGRSHTLMLALMERRLLAESLAPAAATGEIDADGATVRTVEGLVVKARAWFHRFPEGWLLTPPPGPLSRDDLHELTGRRGYGRDGGQRRWVVGGSLAEFGAKLGTTSTAIHAWDGRPIADEGLAFPTLRWEGGQPKNAPFHDGLLDAALAASGRLPDAPPTRGVLIIGAPGSGKSILSRQLERAFCGGLLGALGSGVRRAARELMVDLAVAGFSDWARILAHREPARREVFDELQRTGRLVPIVDGLDELDPVDLRRLGELLRGAPGWWIVTGRPLPAIVNALPTMWQLRIEDLTSDEGKRILTGLGRPDLVDRLYGEGYSRSPSVNPGITELCRTPFHLTLLARVLQVGEDPASIDLHTLYRRAFDGLLDQARLDARLTEREVRLLTSLLDTVVGELARTWMLSGARYLTRAAVLECLEDAGLSASERVDTIRALEFGYLLAPAAGAWEFAHRTLAEWAAASAIHTRVRREIRRVQHECRAVDFAGLAAIEAGALAPFLGNGLVNGSRWVQLLRFYAPFIVAPEPLVAALLGPGTRARWRVPERHAPWRRHHGSEDESGPSEPMRDARAEEMAAEWDFAVELVTATPWPAATEARAMWALVVRARMVGLLKGNGQHRRDGPHSRIELLAAAVGRHLPRTWDEFVSLAAGATEREAGLRSQVAVLLEAVPAERAAAVEELLRRPDDDQRLLALHWFERHRLAPPSGVLLALLSSLPLVESACIGRLATLPSRWGTGVDWPVPPREGESEDERERVGVEARLRSTRDLEAAAWAACHRTGVGVPWSVARERLAAWPHHLEAGLLGWFGRSGEDRSWRGSPPDEEVLHRRLSLSLVLAALATADEIVREGLAFYREVSYGVDVVERALHRLDDEDDRSRRNLLEEYLKAMSWEVRRGWRHTDGPAHSVAVELAAAVDLVRSLRRRLTAVVSAIHESKFDEVAGELWAALPPDDPQRVELLARFTGPGRLPPQVSARIVLAYHEYNRWTALDRGWRPSHLTELGELAERSSGGERFAAILALAHAEKRSDTLALLGALPTGDSELARLIHDHIDHRQTWEEIPTDFLPPEVVAALPLELRAERNVPGWRAELLAKLAGPGGDVSQLADIAAERGVREALPFLIAHIGSASDAGSLSEAIGRLCTDVDGEFARIALFARLRSGRHAWPGARPRRRDYRPFSGEPSPPPEPSAWQRLLRFLRVEDLDQIAGTAASGLHDADLGAAIRGLGMPAFMRLRELHRATAERVRQLRADGPAPPKAHRSWDGLLNLPHGYEGATGPAAKAESELQALGDTLAAVADPVRLDLGEIVALVFDVAGGDVHRVYSTPGPLGADFDDPSDMEWSSTQENAPIVKCLETTIQARLDLAPSEWPALRRLFRHPSESLRKCAFELAARLAPSHAIITLALEALEGHARCNHTRLSGESMGLMLAGLRHGGTGSVNVNIPDTAGTLVGAVRARLTAAHRSVIETLCQHELPGFRALAAGWAGELGPAEWATLVEPLLADPEPHVMLAGARALWGLTGATLAERLRCANRGRWTTVHDVFLLRDLLTRMRGQSWWDEEDAADPLETVPADLLVELLVESATRMPAEELGDRPASIFDGFPTLVERAAQHLHRDAGNGKWWTLTLRAWTEHPSPKVRAVARRLRSERGDLGRFEVEGLLRAPASLDRLSGAECLVRLGATDRIVELRRYWAAALGFTGHEAPASRRRILGLGPAPPRFSFVQEHVEVDELQDRLLWALEGAPVRFAPLLHWIAREIPTDPEDCSDTPHGRELVAGTVRIVRRWGGRGALALLAGMEAGKVEDHYHFTALVSGAARSRRVRREIRRRAAAGGEVAQRVVEGWKRKVVVPELDVLEERVREVFLAGNVREQT